MADYKKWNDEAFKISNEKKDTCLETVKLGYKDIIKKYCRPDFKGQNIAFGSLSSHDSVFEKIESSKINGKKAIIRTHYKHLKYSYEDHRYEYVFEKRNSIWYLEHLYYVDKSRKYEGL